MNGTKAIEMTQEQLYGMLGGVALWGALGIIATSVLAWAVITAYEKVSEGQMPKRLKAALPLVLGIPYAFLMFPQFRAWNVLIGVVIGALSTSLYDTVTDIFFKAFTSFVQRIFSTITGQPPSNPADPIVVPKIDKPTEPTQPVEPPAPPRI